MLKGGLKPMKHSSVNEYVRRIENCLPKIMKGIRFAIPKKVMGIKLNFSQGLALTGLGYHEFCTMTDLSKETGIHLTALTGVIDSLIKEKFVKRYKNPKDRRVVLIKTTPVGRKIVNEVQQYRHKSIKHVIESLNKKERERIINGFEKMVNIFYEQKVKERANK